MLYKTSRLRGRPSVYAQTEATFDFCSLFPAPNTPSPSPLRAGSWEGCMLHVFRARRDFLPIYRSPETAACVQ